MGPVDLRGLDLNLLVALDRLLDRGSVTLAARDLGLTQSAMSRTLQRLREALDDPLLVRVGRGVLATDRARALRGPLSEALTAVERVFRPPDVFDPASATGEFGLALGEESQVAWADLVVSAIWAVSPGIDVRVRRLSADSLDEGRRGLFDLAVAPDLGGLPPIAGTVDYGDFVARPLYVRRFVTVRSASRAPVDTLEDWLAASHTIVSFDGGGRGFVDELLSARGLRRRVAASVTSFPSAARLVARTDLVATLPEEVVWTSGEPLVACVPPVPIPPVPILSVWHPRRTPDPRHRFYRELVARTITAAVTARADGDTAG